MTQDTPDVTSAAPPPAVTCARCGKELGGDDRVDADDRSFCRACYETLRLELEQVVSAISTDINYPAAFLGAVLGGVAGTLLWWGFTVVTKLALGLIAIAIGYFVGWGTTRFAGGKRSRGLQVLAAAVALVSFFAASYLVNATFMNRALAAQGADGRVPLFTADPALFVRVIAAGFNLMDLVFLAIVLWESWRMPAPPRLPDRPAA